ncbi:MAG: cyclic nucleotide-binding domain-containing protein [Myxococcota bacterium]
MLLPQPALLRQLRTSSLFGYLSDEQLSTLISAGSGGLQRPFDTGELIFEAGQFGSTVFVLLEGRVTLRTLKRGELKASVVRQLLPGELFGEEPLLGGGRRIMSAVAEAPSVMLELSRTPLQRLFSRESQKAQLEQELTRIRRLSLVERLSTTALLKDLSRSELETLAGQVKVRHVARQSVIYREGEPATACYIIAEGQVSLGRQVGGMHHLRAWCSSGDFFGDLEIVHGGERTVTATAQASVELFELPASVLLELRQQHPGLGDAMRRLASERQLLIKGMGDPLAELIKVGDRVGVAQSLLLIDLNTCVRCGNCAWSCEQTHGRSRLVRRGEALTHTTPEKKQTKSLLPSSCQHCTDAACMSGCPTGAIARALDGEVFVRDESCIGCGDCSKRCPWGNISMAPVSAEESLKLPGGVVQKERAVKCDNCRLYEVSACVHNCPTGAMRRVKAAEYFPELAQLAGITPPPPPARSWKGLLGRSVVWLSGLGVPLGALWFAWRSPAPLRGGSTLGLWCGAGALALMTMTVLYSGRKRWIGKLMQLNRRPEAGRGLEKAQYPVTVDLRHWLPMHMLLALGACVLAGVHAGGVHTAQGWLLFLLFCGVMLTGVVGWWLYRALPPLLTAIEETPALQEELQEQAQSLWGMAEELAQAQPEVLEPVRKRLVRSLQSPRWPLHIYQKRLGMAALIRRVMEQHQPLLHGLSSEQQLAVQGMLELLARYTHLKAQRGLQLAMRRWLAPHILAAVALSVLLALHLIQVALY